MSKPQVSSRAASQQHLPPTGSPTHHPPRRPRPATGSRPTSSRVATGSNPVPNRPLPAMAVAGRPDYPRLRPARCPDYPKLRTAGRTAHHSQLRPVVELWPARLGNTQLRHPQLRTVVVLRASGRRAALVVLRTIEWPVLRQRRPTTVRRAIVLRPRSIRPATAPLRPGRRFAFGRPLRPAGRPLWPATRLRPADRFVWSADLLGQPVRPGRWPGGTTGLLGQARTRWPDRLRPARHRHRHHLLLLQFGRQ